MKVGSEMSAEEKHRWKVVRCDSFTDVPGEIVEADDATGEVKMLVKEQGKDPAEVRMSFGTDAIKIVRRAR